MAAFCPNSNKYHPNCCNLHCRNHSCQNAISYMIQENAETFRWNEIHKSRFTSGTRTRRLFLTLLSQLPPEGSPTLMQWLGLCRQMILRATLVVALLLVGAPTADKSRMTTQTKRGSTLLLRAGGWANNPIPFNISFMKFQPKPQNGNWKFMKTPAKEVGFGICNVRSMLRQLIKDYHNTRVQQTSWLHRRPDGKGMQ